MEKPPSSEKSPDMNTIFSIMKGLEGKTAEQQKSELASYVDDYTDQAQQEIMSMSLPEDINSITDQQERREATQKWQQEKMDEMKSDPKTVLGALTQKLEEIRKQEQSRRDAASDIKTKESRKAELHLMLGEKEARLAELKETGVGDQEGLGDEIANIQKEISNL